MLQNAAAGRVVVAVDIDRNGTLDVILTLNGKLSVLLGKGDGTFFTPLITQHVVHNQWAVQDFNRDGKPDVVSVGGLFESPVSMHLGNGDGSFRSPVNYPGASQYPFSITTGDVNSDGSEDVIVGYGVGAGVLLGNGNGTLQPVAFSPIFDSFGGSTVIGDFNGDGNPDLVLGSSTSKLVVIAFGNGSGAFQQVASFPVPGRSAGSFVADFNGDGRLDLALAGESEEKWVGVFLAGQFSGLGIQVNHRSRLKAGESTTYELAVYNPRFAVATGTVTVTGVLPPGLTGSAITGSGWTCSLSTLACSRPDSLATGHGYPPIRLTVRAAANLAPGTVQISASVAWNGVSNTADATTMIVSATTTTLSVTPNPSILGQAVSMTATVSAGTGVVNFFDGETFLGGAPIVNTQGTLVTKSSRAGARRITALYLGDATRSFSRSAPVVLNVAAMPSSAFLPAASPSTGQEPDSIAVADFNGDGFADLITSNVRGNSVSVLQGNGNGTFQAKTDYPVGPEPRGLAIADFNGDGKADIAIASSVSESVNVLLNAGNGTFLPATSVAVASVPNRLAAADFNGDGVPDLAVAHSTNYLVVLLGNGDGSFSILPPRVMCCGFVASADVNGDAFVDLVNSSISLGNGDGTFRPHGSVGFNPVAGELEDVTGDGNLDLVASAFSELKVSVGKADGTFNAPNSYASNHLAGVATADVNGDGKVDVVGTNRNANTATVWIGSGSGTMSSALLLGTGAAPTGVATADFNGDGRTDVAVANSVSHNVTVLLGVLTPSVSVTKTHGASFFAGQTGAPYTITVSNGGPGATVGAVSVTDTLPAGLTATAISGAGWTCVLGTLTCSRSDALAANASYPPITLTVNVASNAAAQVTNQVTVSGGGSPVVSASDPTTIVASADPPALLFPTDLAVKVSNTPVLVWTAAPWATSYDVYFGSTNPPPLAGNVTTTSFAPGTLTNGGTFYWRVVAKAGSFTSSSTTRSFTVFNSGTAPVSLTPVTGTAGRQVFNFRARHITAATNIQYAQFLFTKSGLNAANACYISHDPVGNVFYLLNDDMTQWFGLLGGTAGTVGNSQCTIHGATSGSSRSGTDLVTNIDLSFRSGFAGVKNIYQFSADTQGNTSGWQGMGTWNDTGNPGAVELISLTPSSGAGASQAFTAVVRDGDGGSTIPFVQMVMNASLSGFNGCFIHYDRASNTFFLLNNAGTSWSGLVGGSGGQVSNSQCTLRGTGSGG
ncbi:MAG: FG-GAP-like repeat-containing protein, partial [Bryobacteraceae bacterium]|nr:FG-GAP-like repeat-containing protein [Bryobacteraceae bacterium]